MTSIAHQWEDVVQSLYYKDKGHKVPRHVHKNYVHTHYVVKGKSFVEMFGDKPKSFTMKPGDAPFVFPIGVEHEITAEEDGSIFLHLMKSKPAPELGAVSDGAPGGVMMDDGTVAYEEDTQRG